MTENVEEVEDKGDTAEEGDDDTWEGVWGQAHRLSTEDKDQQKTKLPPEDYCHQHFNHHLLHYHLGVADTAFFKKMNIFIEWIIRLFFEWINSLNEYFSTLLNE